VSFATNRWCLLSQIIFRNKSLKNLRCIHHFHIHLKPTFINASISGLGITFFSFSKLSKVFNNSDYKK
jgi:hypothetical protein